jgi:hypothetical protein
MADFEPRYAITFGGAAILHVGGAKLGTARAEGFSVAELRTVAAAHPGAAELVMISDVLPETDRAANEAAVLILRGGARLLGADPDELLREQRGVSYDRKYWDVRRRAALNKRARYNIVFGSDGQAHNEDYTEPTVQAFAGVPRLAEVRDRLPEILGPKAADLNAEGNHYFEPKSGIGFHGDAERRIVVCCSLGGASTLRFHWRLPGSSAHTLPAVDLRIGHGNLYCMSEKATGWDWKFRSKTRVVHAAGAAKYL